MKAYVVDSAAVRSNLQQLQTRAGSAVLWAVLKGDGYGLGLLPMAAICREAGVTHFAVTEVSEVSRLRAGGFADASILMLRPTSEQDELRQLLQLGAILTVSSQNDAAVLNGVAQELGVQAEVHVKIDTGMGRYGFLPDELDQLLPIFKYMPGLHVTGIYTHLHSAFCNQKATIAQAEAFQGVLDKLHAEGCGTGMAHMLNSAGLLKYPEYAMDGVRVGSAILGRVSVRGNWGLARIGECQATVEELRWLPKGHSCGYGAGWTAKKPTRVAVFSVGWYHGFGVEMGNDLFRFRDCLRGVLRNLKQMVFKKHIYVTVNGKKCRVLGHIGMLHTCVDVTKLQCAVGDTAIFDIKPLLLKLSSVTDNNQTDPAVSRLPPPANNVRSLHIPHGKSFSRQIPENGMTEKGIVAHLLGLYHTFRNFPNFLTGYIQKDYDFQCKSDIKSAVFRSASVSDTEPAAHPHNAAPTALRLCPQP